MTPLEACDRARRAWERSQPQLFMELYPDSGLDEREEAPGLALVEPAVLPLPPRGGLDSPVGGSGSRGRNPSGDRGLDDAISVSPAAAASRGLTLGAEPCCDTTTGLTALRAHRPEDSPVVALAARSAGSAPLHNTTGPDAPPARMRVRP